MNKTEIEERLNILEEVLAELLQQAPAESLYAIRKKLGHALPSALRKAVDEGIGNEAERAGP